MAAEAVGAAAAQRGVAPVVSAVDAGGELMFLVRPDAAQVASVQVTTDKARTAAIYRRPSKDFEDQASGGRPSALHLARAVPLQGGMPIEYDGEVSRRGRRQRRARRPTRTRSSATIGAAASSRPPLRRRQATAGRAAAAGAYADGAPHRQPHRRRLGPAPARASPELLPGRPDAIVDLQTDAGAALVGARWRYADAGCSEIDFVEVGGPDAADPLGPGRRPQPHLRRRAPRRGRRLRRLGLGGSWRPPTRSAGSRSGRVCFNWYRTARHDPRARRRPRPDRRHRRLRGRDRRLRRGVGRRRRCRSRSATPAARSSAASTRPTASCSRATRGRATASRSPSSASTARSPPRRATTSGCARRRSTSTRRARAAARARARSRSSASTPGLDDVVGAGRAPRAGGRRLRVHRGPGVDARRRAALLLAEHERDLPLGPARRR